MRILSILGLSLLAIGVMPGLASAACTGSGPDGTYSYPNGSEGSLYFDDSAPGNPLKICVSGNWVNVTSSNYPSSIYIADGMPTVGDHGGKVVTLCNVDLGEPCGGGLYAGDGNLVAAPSGCYDQLGLDNPIGDYSPFSTTPKTRCPTDFDQRDYRRVKWSNGDNTPPQSQSGMDASYAFNLVTFSRRYGWALTQKYANLPEGNLYKFCKNLQVTSSVNGVPVTFNDWYVPTRDEMAFVMYATPRIGGSAYGTVQNSEYWTATMGINGYQAEKVRMPVPLAEQGYYGESVAEGNTQTNRIRCVRRN